MIKMKKKELGKVIEDIFYAGESIDTEKLTSILKLIVRGLLDPHEDYYVVLDKEDKIVDIVVPDPNLTKKEIKSWVDMDETSELLDSQLPDDYQLDN